MPPLTFEIITPSTVTSRTITPISTGVTDPAFPASDAEIIASIISTGLSDAVELGLADAVNPSISGVVRFGFSLSDSIIKLNGGAAQSYDSLPAGFTPLSCIFTLASLGTSPAANCFLQMNELTEGSVFNPDVFPGVSGSVSYDFTPPTAPTMLDIINNGCGIRVQFTGDPTLAAVDVDTFSFTGTYSIVAFQFSIDTPTTNVKPGTLITITSDPNDPTHLKLDQQIPNPPDTKQVVQDTIPVGPYFVWTNSQSLLQYLPLIDFITFTEVEWSFYFPDLIPDDPSFLMDLVIQGNGTQFSGSLTLGTFTILYENASGIYRIVPNKRSDTIYDRTGDTAELKIPDPFAITAYIGT